MNKLPYLRSPELIPKYKLKFAPKVKTTVVTTVICYAPEDLPANGKNSTGNTLNIFGGVE